MQYAKLKQRLSQQPSKVASTVTPPTGNASDKPVGAATPIIDQLHRFAAHMGGGSFQHGHTHQSESDPTPITREVLNKAAHQLGLGVQYIERELATLSDEDFPCLLPLNDGTAYLATGLQNKTVLLVETQNRIETVPFALFQTQYAGLLLQLQPLKAPEQLSRQDAGRQNESAAKADTGERKLAAKIFSSIIGDYKARLMQLALAASMSNMLLVVLPLFIMSVYDRIIPHLAMETLWALAIGVMLALLIDFGLRVSRSTLLESIATSVSNDYQGRFYGRLLHLEMSSMPRLAGGLSGAIQEFENLCRIVPQGIIALAVDLPFFILLLGLLYYMGGAVVVAPILGILVIAVANIVTYAKSRQVNIASTELAHKRANQLIETLGAIETIKSTRCENQMLAQWEQRTDAGAYLSFLARHQTGFASHLTIITVQVTIVLTLIIGVYELRTGGITMGALAASSLLVGRAMAPMGNLIALFARGFHILRSSSAIEQILAASQEKAGDTHKGGADIFKGQIRCNSVNFGYEASLPPVLKNISLTIEPGERVALIGRIGCGKSSLLKLLPRLHQVSSGSLLLDGHDIRQFEPSLLRQNMALMPQEALLVEGSLRDNICFGQTIVEEQTFERIVEISGVKDFASVHPQGYGLQVGPRGEKLSGGERASVVLARTLMQPSKMLLLDEPTAAMDNELERRIVTDLSGWLGTRTLILATHRAPMLALVDRIIWLHNGQVIADGPRDDVLAKLKG